MDDQLTLLVEYVLKLFGGLLLLFDFLFELQYRGLLFDHDLLHSLLDLFKLLRVAYLLLFQRKLVLLALRAEGLAQAGDLQLQFLLVLLESGFQLDFLLLEQVALVVQLVLDALHGDLDLLGLRFLLLGGSLRLEHLLAQGIHLLRQLLVLLRFQDQLLVQLVVLAAKVGHV